MLAKVRSGTVIGLDAKEVTVEIDITKKGFGGFKIVGLAGKAVDESKDRVKTAIENSKLSFTKYKITVNLAPADLHKDGPLYDLPIAVGILVAMKQINPDVDLSNKMFFGELSLDGSLNSTPAILPLAILAKEHGVKEVYVSAINAKEASLVNGVTVFPIKDLSSLILHLNGQQKISPLPHSTNLKKKSNMYEVEYGLEDVKGQHMAKRALTIAAAGNHNILFTGPPGSGKTMLARLLPQLLPDLTWEEALEVTKIHSIANDIDPENPLITTRPFRSPHHTTSRVGLIGGGTYLSPGEISLAHRGVLFMDEIPEFPRSVLESLRQPMEDGVVTITRARGSVKFPALFMLVAASNPCPCGYRGSKIKQCYCSPTKLLNYQRRISGPLLDRIDIHVFVQDTDPKAILSQHNKKPTTNDRSETVKAKELIKKVRQKQLKRYENEKILTNGEIHAKLISKYCHLSKDALELLAKASTNLGLSGRSIHKVQKIARTIADIDDSTDIQSKHLIEALQYRPKIK